MTSLLERSRFENNMAPDLLLCFAMHFIIMYDIDNWIYQVKRSEQETYYFVE